MEDVPIDKATANGYKPHKSLSHCTLLPSGVGCQTMDSSTVLTRGREDPIGSEFQNGSER